MADLDSIQVKVSSCRTIMSATLGKIFWIVSVAGTFSSPINPTFQNGIEIEFITEHHDESELVKGAMDNLWTVVKEANMGQHNVSKRSSEGNVHCMDNCKDKSNGFCFKESGFRFYKRIPDCPEEVNTKFLLFTPSNHYDPTVLTPLSDLGQSLPENFDPKLPMKVIVHGWG